MSRMFLHFAKRNYISLLFVALIIGCAIACFIVDTYNDYKVIGAAFIALATVLLTIMNSNRDNDRFTKELFTEFNCRYNKMNEFLNSIDDTEINHSDSVVFRNKIYDYLNLCSEEYYWYHRGHIPELIWENWMSGVKEHLNNEKVRTIFYEEFRNDNNVKSYYGFLQYMEPFIKRNLQ